MKNKLWVKLAIVFLLVAFSTIVLAGGIINIALNKRFEDYVKNNVQAKNQRIVDSLESIYQEQGSWYNIKQKLMALEMMTGRRVRITTKNDKNVFDSKYDCMSNRKSQRNTDDNCMPGNMRGKGKMGRGMMQNNQDNKSFNSGKKTGQTVKLPIEVDSKVVGYAHVTPLDREGFWSKQDMVFRKTINSSIIIAGVIAGIVALLISFIISKKITSPIQKMTSVAQSMAEGNLARRVDVDSQDEIGVLGEQLNQLAAHLQKLEKLRKKLTADVAHELRTPITTIQSYIEAFQDGVMSVNQANLNAIHEEIIRLVDLVNDLQELSITEGGRRNFEFEQINLNQFVQNSVQSLVSLFKSKNIDLDLNLSNEEIKLHFDRESLNKIIYNILSNAHKYTEQGGEVTIDVTQKDSNAVIRIEDNGIGISEEELPYIFERFYRIDESRTRETGGTGIGLAIVKELVEAHNGQIDVKSELGEGTEFIISLPLKKI